jgi:hypothetical protein
MTADPEKWQNLMPGPVSQRGFSTLEYPCRGITCGKGFRGGFVYNVKFFG